MNKPVAIRYDFDGYGYQYMDSGSGSDWQTRVDGEPLYTHPVKEQELLDEIEALKKQVVIWERSSKDRAIKLNICAIKVSELEKKLDTRTKELIGASFYEHDYKTMMANNKPVAYWDGKHFASKDKSSLADIPLYTHPVKELTLTDEDILEEWTCKYSDCYQDTLIDFARAILRKAQEKC